MKPKKKTKKRPSKKKPTHVEIHSWCYPWMFVDFKKKEIFASMTGDFRGRFKVYPE